MIEACVALSDRALQALAELEQRVLAVDGGRLKLEWGTLRARPGQQIEDLLWWEGEELVGFLGLYAFGGPSVELAGMVSPAWRRRGGGGALLEAALTLCRERGAQQALLVVPRSSEAGQRLAVRRTATLAHSEHALVLRTLPPTVPKEPDLLLRPALAADNATVLMLLEAAFARPMPGWSNRKDTPDEQTLIIELSGNAVGTMRLTQTKDEAGIYGFAVAPTEQGKGIGRTALRRVCQQLFAEGAQCVALEVEVNNDRALGLYTSVGFERVTTEDYYAIPLN